MGKRRIQGSLAVFLLVAVLLAGVGCGRTQGQLQEQKALSGTKQPSVAEAEETEDVGEAVVSGKGEISTVTEAEETEDALQEDTAVQSFSFSEIQNMEAGTMLEADRLTQELADSLFYSTEITEAVKGRIWNISYRENDNISLSELRYLRTLYRGFDGETYIGELIVNQSIAEDILEIMAELYSQEYPIEKMVLVDEYNGSDDASMSDNNTSAFNYRTIAGSDKLSNHSMGRAIDINPRYNPYVKEKSSGEVIISPENGADYADRSRDFSYKIDENDLCCRLFREHGFTWGGDWNSVKDYQHFEK